MHSAMSNCGEKRCYNAAYSWNLGWSENVAVVDSTELESGICINVYRTRNMMNAAQD